MPLYMKCGERLTKSVASEFGEEYRIRFDLSKIQALQEDRDARRRWAREGWESGLLTFDEARIMAGESPVGGDEGGARKDPSAADNPLAALVAGRQAAPGPTHTHAAALTQSQRKAQARFKKVAKAHFSAQSAAVLSYLQ